jgi:hypothetical protein
MAHAPYVDGTANAFDLLHDIVKQEVRRGELAVLRHYASTCAHTPQFDLFPSIAAFRGVFTPDTATDQQMWDQLAQQLYTLASEGTERQQRYYFNCETRVRTWVITRLVKTRTTPPGASTENAVKRDDLVRLLREDANAFLESPDTAHGCATLVASGPTVWETLKHTLGPKHAAQLSLGLLKFTVGVFALIVVYNWFVGSTLWSAGVASMHMATLVFGVGLSLVGCSVDTLDVFAQPVVAIGVLVTRTFTSVEVPAMWQQVLLLLRAGIAWRMQFLVFNALRRWLGRRLRCVQSFLPSVPATLACLELQWLEPACRAVSHEHATVHVLCVVALRLAFCWQWSQTSPMLDGLGLLPLGILLTGIVITVFATK